MKKRFMHPAISLYTRKRLTSKTGREYWGFEPVKLGAGRKQAGPFWLRHTDEQGGGQKWVPAGETFAEATALRDKMIAVKMAARGGLTVDEADRKEAANYGSVRVKDAVKDFLKAKEHKSKKTVVAYKHALDNFVEGLPSGVRFVEDITERTIRAFVDRMTKTGLAPNTVKNRALIVTFLLKHQGSKIKTRWAELPKAETKPVKAFSQEQLKKLFSQMDDKQTTVFSFFLGTGCR